MIKDNIKILYELGFKSKFVTDEVDYFVAVDDILYFMVDVQNWLREEKEIELFYYPEMYQNEKDGPIIQQFRPLLKFDSEKYGLSITFDETYLREDYTECMLVGLNSAVKVLTFK